MNINFKNHISKNKYILPLTVFFLLLFIAGICRYSSNSASGAKERTSAGKSIVSASAPSYCKPLSEKIFFTSCLEIKTQPPLHYAPELYNPVLYNTENSIAPELALSNFIVRYETLGENLENNICNAARRYMGIHYLPGGTSPSEGFDCSGFVFYVLHRCGYRFTERTCNNIHRLCTVISESEVKAGDLVFFKNTTGNSGYTHVGICLGDGTMIHAGTRGICIVDLNDSYWKKHNPSYARLYPADSNNPAVFGSLPEAKQQSRDNTL